MATRPIVKNLPPAPLPTDSIEDFDSKAFDHVAALDQFVGEVNDVTVYVNSEADRANTRANASASSATASANSATRSDEWANKAPGSVVASGKYSARHYSDLSDRFANAPEDVEVVPGKYSALHWQEKAKKIANVHATTVATDPLPTVLATNVQEALRDLAYQSDQLRVANNQLKYGDGPYPVLDFQFQGAKYLDPQLQFTRASKDWDSQGREYGIDAPVLMDKGLWVSGARTNLLRNTIGFDYPMVRLAKEDVGGYQRFTITGDDFTSAAYAWPFASSMSYGVGYNCVSVEVDLSEMYSESTFRIVFHGASFNSGGSRFIAVNLDGSYTIEGVSADGGVTHLGGRRYRIHLSADLEVVGQRAVLFGIYPKTGKELLDGDSFLARNLQLESGVTPTAHIPTEGSQVTVAESRLRGINLGQAKSVVFDMQRVRNLTSNTVYFATLSSHLNQTIPTNGVLIWSINKTQIIFRVYRGGNPLEFIGINGNWETVRKIGFSVSGGLLTASVDGETGSVYSQELADVEDAIPYLNLSQELKHQSKYSWIRSVACYERALTTEQLQELTS